LRGVGERNIGGVEERTSNRVSEIVFNRERREEILIIDRGYEQETRKR